MKAWLAIHHLFHCGVTFLSCIAMASRGLVLPTPIEAIMDVQACAGVLEALTGAEGLCALALISAHVPGTSGIRDAFELVSTAVVSSFTSQPDQSRMLNNATTTSPVARVGPAPPAIDPAPAEEDWAVLFGEDQTMDALNTILFEPVSIFSSMHPVDSPIESSQLAHEALNLSTFDFT
jgi:hypothetical protein